MRRSVPERTVKVTYVVKAMIEIAEGGKHMHQTYHIVDSMPPKNLELLNQVGTILGTSCLTLFEHRTRPMEGMTLLERKVDELLHPYRDYFFESPIFDDTNARQLLDGRVEPCSATALRLLICAAASFR